MIVTEFLSNNDKHCIIKFGCDIEKLINDIITLITLNANLLHKFEWSMHILQFKVSIFFNLLHLKISSTI